MWGAININDIEKTTEDTMNVSVESLAYDDPNRDGKGLNKMLRSYAKKQRQPEMTAEENKVEERMNALDQMLEDVKNIKVDYEEIKSIEVDPEAEKRREELNNQLEERKKRLSKLIQDREAADDPMLKAQKMLDRMNASNSNLNDVSKSDDNMYLDPSKKDVIEPMSASNTHTPKNIKKKNLPTININHSEDLPGGLSRNMPDSRGVREVAKKSKPTSSRNIEVADTRPLPSIPAVVGPADAPLGAKNSHKVNHPAASQTEVHNNKEQVFREFGRPIVDDGHHRMKDLSKEIPASKPPPHQSILRDLSSTKKNPIDDGLMNIRHIDNHLVLRPVQNKLSVLENSAPNQTTEAPSNRLKITPKQQPAQRSFEVVGNKTFTGSIGIKSYMQDNYPLAQPGLPLQQGTPKAPIDQVFSIKMETPAKQRSVMRSTSTGSFMPARKTQNRFVINKVKPSAAGKVDGNRDIRGIKGSSILHKNESLKIISYSTAEAGQEESRALVPGRSKKKLANIFEYNPLKVSSTTHKREVLQVFSTLDNPFRKQEVKGVKVGLNSSQTSLNKQPEAFAYRVQGINTYHPKVSHKIDERYADDQMVSSHHQHLSKPAKLSKQASGSRMKPGYDYRLSKFIIS